MADLPAELNRLAGTTNLDAAKAANVIAGTTNLDLVGALNVKAGTTGLELNGVCKRLALDYGGNPALDGPGALASISAFSVPPSYTRVDPYVAYSGKVGDVNDEMALERVLDTNRNAIITHSMTNGPDGDGGWKFVGGNQSGDCCRMSESTTVPMGSGGSVTELWTQMRFKVVSLHSAAVNLDIMVGVTKGDGANEAGDKPCIKLSNTGQLIFGDSNGSTHDVNLGSPLSLGTVYHVMVHALGGVAGSLTHEAFLYSATGVLLDSKSSAWAIGNAGSNQVCKWGNSGGGNSTGLELHFSEMTVFRNISTNPGPCRVGACRASSVVGAGNFTVVGAGDIPTAMNENVSAARAGTLTTTAGSTAISSTDLSFTANDVGGKFSNHAGITNTSRVIATVTDANNANLDSSTGVVNSAAGTCTFQKRGNDADTSYAVVNNATASTLEVGLTNLGIAAEHQIHAVTPIMQERHITSPTIQLGVKSGSTSELLSIYPNSVTAYGGRRAATSVAATAPAHSLDPATGARWTSAAIDAMTGLIRDNDALAREFRITNYHVQVVYAMVAA